MPRNLALAAFVLVLALLSVRTAGRANEGDLRVYYDTVSRVTAGLDLYEHREEPPGADGRLRPTGYIYPPLFAALFLPLTGLPFAWVRGLWFFAMGLVALRAYLLAWRLVTGSLGPPRGRWGWLLAGVGIACSLRFVWSDLGHGQANVLMIGLALEGIAAVEAGRERWGGALLAGAVLVKLTPAILVAGYLLERRWRVGTWVAIGGALGLLAPAIALGPEAAFGGLWRFVSAITPWNAEFHAHVGNNLALSGWLLRLLAGEADAGQAPRTLLLALDPGAVRWGLRLLSAAILVAALAWVRRIPDRIARQGLLLAAIPLVSPIAWKPHLASAILPALLLGRGLAAGALPRWPAALGLLLVGLTARGLIGRSAANLATLWGVPTLGLVLWAAALACWQRPAADPASDPTPGPSSRAPGPFSA